MKRSEIPESADECRKLYARIRARSQARTPAEFDAAARKVVEGYCVKAGGPSPQQWVKAAMAVRLPCRRCAGTGKFITYVENGVPKGPGGDCYRCQGRGTQNDADARRNYGADMHQRVY